MESPPRSAPYVDVEICFRADPRLRAMVRAVAAEAAQPGQAYVNEVWEATDALVCALLVFAQHDSRLRCLFRVLDGELRIRVCLPDATVSAPEVKSRSARVLDRLDVHVNMFTAEGDTNGTELVCETVVPRRDSDDGEPSATR